MKFLIVTQAVHQQQGKSVYAYAPYVREMNLWAKKVDELIVIAPKDKRPLDALGLAYDHSNIRWVRVPAFHLQSFSGIICTIISLPYIFCLLLYYMAVSDHIHLRCPGNMGLLGVLVQFLFPARKKTVKYAGNWDPNSKQPRSYKWQQSLLRSSLSKRMKVLVYGDWQEKAEQILPFFTASYSKNLDQPFEKKYHSSTQCCFVGGLVAGKRPEVAVQTVIDLNHAGMVANMHVCGSGPMKDELKKMVEDSGMTERIVFHGNLNQEQMIQIYKDCDYLLFPSRSEGWPKVVAEAMWWSCIPITSAVSCVPQMLDDGKRGVLVEPNAETMKRAVIELEEDLAQKKTIGKNAMEWSRNYHLEYFESEIHQLI